VSRLGLGVLQLQKVCMFHQAVQQARKPASQPVVQQLGPLVGLGPLGH
jgi:hypothetical protein